MFAAVPGAKTLLGHLLSPLDLPGRGRGDRRKHSICARHLLIITQLLTWTPSEAHKLLQARSLGQRQERDSGLG